MDKQMIDGMKREGKPFRNIMIFCYIFSIIMPTGIYFMKDSGFSNKDLILLVIFWLLLGTYSLYGWLYAIKYKLEFNDEKVHLKTLFKKIELDICDIEKYTCKRYRKTVFYQFNLFIKEKKVLINTRYKDEFEKILKGHNIEQITK